MLRLKTILQSSNILFIIFLIVLVLSFIRCNIKYKSKYNITDNRIEGVVVQKKLEGNKFSFVIKGKEKIKCTYYLDDEKEIDFINNIELGSTIILDGKLNNPSNNTIPNTFNYRKYLYYKHIHFTMSVDKIIKTNKKINTLYLIKNSIIKRIDRYKSHSYLNSFILGYKSDLDDDVYSNYQELGIAHIFAISGMHISMLVGIMLKIFNKVKDNIKYPIIIIFLLIYIFLTDFQSSVIRSIVLFLVIFINKKIDLNLDTLKSFYISISIILLIDPFRLYDTGFIYSSISSYYLIKYSYIINGNYLLSLLKLSILAFLVTLPITVNINYQINILSIINNIIVVPLISLIIYPLSLLTFIIEPLDPIFRFLMSLFELLSNHLFKINIIIPKMNVIVIIIYYLILYVFLHTYNKKVLLLILLLIIIHKTIFYFDNSYVYYLDVSQGDSSLINNKNKTILIDTGGKVSSEQDVFKKQKTYYYSTNYIKFFKSINISKIDYLVLTHGDYDHMGEAKYLVENFKVEKVIFNCGPYNDLESELIKVLDKKKIKYYSCIKELNIDNNKLYFLQTKEYDNENDNSNVIYTELNGYKFMFMGDAGIEKEKNILEKYNLSNIDVLKVGHHGSKTSSGKEFINEINPKYSIISVGKNNRYGHPNKEVLNNLDDSKIYRTDRDGSIMFKIKNNKLRVETCSP